MPPSPETLAQLTGDVSTLATETVEKLETLFGPHSSPEMIHQLVGGTLLSWALGFMIADGLHVEQIVKLVRAIVANEAASPTA